MNVKIKLNLLIILSFFIIINSSYSVGFNACSVNFNQPWLDVKDNISNDDILIIDNNGNSFFRGVEHNLNNFNTQKSFKIGTAYFNKVTSKFTSFNPNQITLPNNQSLIVKNNLGVDVAKIDKLGNIYTKGKGVFQGSQAGCAPDGLYCNGQFLENRNNYCNIYANKAGTCTYNVLNSQDCLTKLSTDSDGGINYNQKGTVTDYTGCNSAACTSIAKTDFCSGNILTEYANSGASFTTNTFNCSSNNQQYCSNGQVWTTTNTCGVGKCSIGSDQFVQNCAISPPQYSTWTCKDINTKVRSVTTFSPSCSGPATCSQTSSNSNQIVSCGAGNYCSAGNCNALSYSWKTSGFGACSATCGGGTQTRTVWCEDNLGNTVADSFCGGNLNQKGSGFHWDYTNYKCTNSIPPSCSGKICKNSLGQTVSNSNCNGGKPTASQSCNTQACNTFSWSVGNYGTCSATCGGGTQTRSVVCKNQFGTTFADTNCNLATKPTISQSCNTQACAVNYNGYWVSNWGTCNFPNGNTCGTGTQTKLAPVCTRSPYDWTLTPLNCDPATKPAITSRSCSISCYQGYWSIISIGSCSATCGGGSQNRKVVCKENLPLFPGATVADSNCDPATKPAPPSPISCNTQACPSSGTWVSTGSSGNHAYYTGFNSCGVIYDASGKTCPTIGSPCSIEVPYGPAQAYYVNYKCQ